MRIKLDITKMMTLDVDEEIGDERLWNKIWSKCGIISKDHKDHVTCSNTKSNSYLTTFKSQIS